MKKLREDWQLVKCYGENQEISSASSVGTTSLLKGKTNNRMDLHKIRIMVRRCAAFSLSLTEKH